MRYIKWRDWINRVPCYFITERSWGIYMSISSHCTVNSWRYSLNNPHLPSTWHSVWNVHGWAYKVPVEWKNADSLFTLEMRTGKDTSHRIKALKPTPGVRHAARSSFGFFGCAAPWGWRESSSLGEQLPLDSYPRLTPMLSFPLLQGLVSTCTSERKELLPRVMGSKF